MSNPKVLLVGWDAADWKVIHPLMDAGKMPNVQRLVEHGSMAHIATLHPALSPMLWTSIATGKRPFKHGIHGFTEPTADGRAVQPVSNLSRKCKAVWNILHQNGFRSNVIGWWPSHPAEPIRGTMVSDHFHRAFGPLEKGWPLRDGAVHPQALAETLAEFRLHPQELDTPMLTPFVPMAAKIDQKKDKRLLSAAKILCECVSIHGAATWLMENEPWDFFAVYYDAIDHFSHGFMRYHPPRQPWITEEDFELYSNVVSMAYQFHDQMLGTLLKMAGDDVRVILMSDHGFHPDHLRARAIPKVPAGPAVEHRDFGILVLSGPGFRRDELVHGATVLDITPTLLTLFNLPVGDDMDGKVLTGAFEQPPPPRSIPSWEDVPGEDGRHSPDKRLDPVAARESLEQLVALGYIERPGPDTEKAVERTVRELRYNLCESYQDAGRHHDAIEIARELYRTDPDDMRYALKVFTSSQALGDHAEMRRIVDDLDGRRRKLFEEAVGHWQEFAAIAKQRIEERKAKAGEKATPEETAAEVTEAIEAAPEPPEPPEPSEMPDEPEATEAPPPAPARRKRRRKREPIFNAEERTEIAKWSKLTKYQPALVDYLKAQVLTAERKFFDALACLERVRDSDLVRPTLFLQSADLLRRLNRIDDARQTYLKALALDPDNPSAHLGLSRIALRKGEFEIAAQSALDSLHRVYENPMAHLLLGLALAGSGEYARAAQAMRAALTLNPNFPQAHLRLARILKRRLNDPEGAEEHLRFYRELRAKRRRAADAPPSPDRVEALPEALPEAEAQTALPPLGDAVLIVSGLPRSGTSMIMQMLAAGGMPILTDRLREADDDNPRGYWEYEPVKKIHQDAAWISAACGKAIKIVAPLLPALPEGFQYRVILIERDLDEILASQAQMIVRRGEQIQDTPARRERLKEEFSRMVRDVKAALARRPGVALLTVRHEAVLTDPRGVAHAINLFAGGGLSEDKMTSEVEPSLHRQRRK